MKQSVYRNDVIREKTPDVKVAYVMLKEGAFQFPDMFPVVEPTEVDDEDDVISPPTTTPTQYEWFKV